jgi:threonine dehydratase
LTLPARAAHAGGAMSAVEPSLDWPLIEAARRRIAPHVLRTPVLRSSSLDALSGAQLHFKCETFQKGGAFKARGATNAVFALSAAQARHGVATHSSGNHGAALARAARLRGIPAYIVMPDNSPEAKRAAVRRYGGEIRFCAPTLAAREQAARELIASTGAAFVHPYDDALVMAGQASVAVEFLEQVPQLQALICPVGGGGLLGGCAVASAHLAVHLEVLGAEPEGAADAAASLRSGQLQPMPRPDTIADGLRGALSARTFAAIRAHVGDILIVGDADIVAGMRELWSVLKILVEPSGAVPYAALRRHAARFAGRHVGVVLSGANLDLDHLPWAMAR